MPILLTSPALTTASAADYCRKIAISNNVGITQQFSTGEIAVINTYAVKWTTVRG
jgi:hypothetical protein